MTQVLIELLRAAALAIPALFEFLKRVHDDEKTEEDEAFLKDLVGYESASGKARREREASGK